MVRKNKEIDGLKIEIDRQKFLEKNVKKHVSGLVRQNEKCKTFIQSLLSSMPSEGNKIREFLGNIECRDFDEVEGESTENEGNEDLHER